MTPQILGPGTFESQRYLQRPVCPHCGDTLLAAQASALVARGHIENFWACDNCGHDFVTAVRVPLTATWFDDLD
jgi:hypothetical protein